MAHKDAVTLVTGELFSDGWTQSPGGRGQERGLKNGPRFGGARHQHMARAASGNRAVVVKLVRGGGCLNGHQLGNQLEYITGKADVVFDSQGTFEQRGPLSADDARIAAERWKDSWETVPSAGHTAHLIVSFPKDTDAGDVQAITQRFCEQIFDGKYDYVAATHSDRLHPHAHIVVNRHGLEGDLFTLRAGTEHSYEHFKTVLVELGNSHGVDLEATSRLERGIVHRSATDADYRQGRTMDRPRVGQDLEYAQLQITQHSQTYSALATLARGVSAVAHTGFKGVGAVTYTRLGDLIQNLDRASADLKAGRPIIPESYAGVPSDQREAFSDALRRLEQGQDIPGAKMAEATPTESPTLEGDARLNEAEVMRNKASPDTGRAVIYGEPESRLAKPATHGVDPKAGHTVNADPHESDQARQQERFKAGLQQLDQALQELDVRMEKASPSERPALELRLNEVEAMLNRLLPAKDRDVAFDTPASAQGIYSSHNARIAAHYVEVNGAGDIRNTVKGTGLDADVFIARFKLGAPNAALEENWLDSDIRSLAAYKGLDMSRPPERALVLQKLDDLYDRISETISRPLDARDIDGGVWQAHKDRARSVARPGTDSTPERSADAAPAFAKSDLARMPAPTDAERAQLYKQAVENRLTPDELVRLRGGDISSLEGAGTRYDQLGIAREYLKAYGQSPEALRQVSDQYSDERRARWEHDRGIDHG